MILQSILYIFCSFQLWSHPVQSATDEFICVPGLLTWGATSPKGDIMLEAGGTLEVNCTIDLGHVKVKGRTSKDIRFSVDKHEIPDDRLETTIINKSTAMLRVKNMNVSTPLVNCYLPDPKTHICENQVDVGYPPLPVENLKCVARNWASLNCTWNKPVNNIITTYNISYGFREYLMNCINKISLSKMTESCEWNGRTDPHYRQNMKVIPIVMTGTNYLRPEGIRWRHEFHNYEIVIPSAPERLLVEALSPHEISIKWSFHNFLLFEPGLHHRITVCPIEPIHDCLVKDLKFNHIANLTQSLSLPYANTKYRVEVRMKSQVANDTPEFWSPPAIHPVVQTLPKRPDSPPITGIGTFEVFNKYQLRDITIYWKRIPTYLQNGSNFHYKFDVFEDNQRRDIFPKARKGLDYAFFGNLSLNNYRFEIHSVNTEGESEEKAILFVPKSSEVPKEPHSVSKVDYTNGTYEISWRHPENYGLESHLSSYTVYRCRGSKVQCDELVEWIDVEPSKTHYIFEGLEVTGGNHVFAVSSNTKYASSGMIVATCELVHNKIPGKLKEVRGIHSSEKSLQIKWGMDCSFKPGLVTAFRITYCKIMPNVSCSNTSEVEDVIADGDATSWTVENLEPYSSYIIWVSMMTQAGESQTSDPIILKTMEAAPSDPPWVTTITTTNTSALLQIQPPIKSNGVIQKYEIFYKPTSSIQPDQVKSLQTKDLEMDESEAYHYYNVTDLESNTNYTIRISACTTTCSNLSELLYFQTEFGYTKLTAMPALTYEDGRILVSWKSPNHLGGPIEYYEVLVQKNGETAADIEIQYDPGRLTYLEAMDLKCDSSTNITARVRAISMVGTQQLFGNWSPEGTFNCYGSEVWFIWILIVIASLICFLMLTFVSIKCWRKLKAMNSLHVIAPPGMEQLQLNGFSERQGRRVQQAGSDNQPFRKDSLICRTASYRSATCEDTKDFMSSDSKENEKGDEEDMDILHGMNPSMGGDILQNQSLANGGDNCPIWLWHSPLDNIRTRDEEPGSGHSKNSGLNFPLNNNINTLLQNSLPGHNPNSDGLLEKGNSPSPSNRLISDSSATNSGDEGDDIGLAHYRTINFEPYGSLSYYNGDPHYEYSNGPVPIPNGHSNHPTSEDGFDYGNGNGNGVGQSNGVIPNGHVPEVNKESAYVKWTSLKMDPIMGSLNGKTPYCQVGILLEQ